MNEENEMELFEQYDNVKQQIFDYFGYVEDWRVLPMVFDTEYFWYISGSEESGNVVFAETVEQLEDEDSGNYYENEIYTQRHLSKWVYRGEDYTMICVDTHCDRNQYLQILSNDKEVKL
jgi:hypothetical protein